MLRVRTVMLEVDGIGFEMRDALTTAQFQLVPDIVKRMELASALLAGAAQDFHAAMKRAGGGEPSS